MTLANKSKRDTLQIDMLIYSNTFIYIDSNQFLGTNVNRLRLLRSEDVPLTQTSLRSLSYSATVFDLKPCEKESHGSPPPTGYVDQTIEDLGPLK